jgi:hypothetical protein
LNNRWRDLSTWLLPDAWHGPFSEVAYRLQKRRLLRRLASNAELAGKHQHERRCFVIGNGPSLNTQDLSRLSNEFTIVANSFFQHERVDQIQPDYCCVGDPDFIADTPNAIAWLRQLEGKLPATTLFFRPWAPEVFRRHNLFMHHKVHYLDSVAKVPHASQVHIDLTRPLNVGYTTGSQFSIPLALFLGFREVYLIGFDANWLADIQKGRLHFYATNPQFPHFDHTVTEGHSMEEQLRTMHLEFRSHRFLRNVAERRGQHIRNATNGGWLDMYERTEYQRLFTS